MSEIKRYYLDPELFALVVHENGEVVDYQDYLAAIKQARIDAVREVLSRIEKYKNITLDTFWDIEEIIELYVEEQLKEQGE